MNQNSKAKPQKNGLKKIEGYESVKSELYKKAVGGLLRIHARKPTTITQLNEFGEMTK